MHVSRRAIYALLVLCAVGVEGNTEAAADEPWGLPQLMAALAQVGSATGQFTEQKTLHMLSAPLILAGRLVYVAPGHVEKITLSPTSESLVMDGDRVTMVTGPNRETHTFSVGDYPEIGGLVAGIRATLAGDLRTLDHFYTVGLSGTSADWDLRLVPRDHDLTRFVKWIEFRGSGDRIATIDTEDSDGDHSTMTIVEDRRDAR